MESVATPPKVSAAHDRIYPKPTGMASPVLVSIHEEMNPAKRSTMEDCCVYSAPGTWDAPDNDMAYLGVYDGHGGTFGK
jgi:hypothetical protein